MVVLVFERNLMILHRWSRVVEVWFREAIVLRWFIKAFPLMMRHLKFWVFFWMGMWRGLKLETGVCRRRWRWGDVMFRSMIRHILKAIVLVVGPMLNACYCWMTLQVFIAI